MSGFSFVVGCVVGLVVVGRCGSLTDPDRGQDQGGAEQLGGVRV